MNWTQKTFDPGPMLTLGPGLRIGVAINVTRTENKWDAYVFGRRIDGEYPTEIAAKNAAIETTRKLMLAALKTLETAAEGELIAV